MAQPEARALRSQQPALPSGRLQPRASHMSMSARRPSQTAAAESTRPPHDAHTLCISRARTCTSCPLAPARQRVRTPQSARNVHRHVSAAASSAPMMLSCLRKEQETGATTRMAAQHRGRCEQCARTNVQKMQAFRSAKHILARLSSGPDNRPCCTVSSTGSHSAACMRAARRDHCGHRVHPCRHRLRDGRAWLHAERLRREQRGLHARGPVQRGADHGAGRAPERGRLRAQVRVQLRLVQRQRQPRLLQHPARRRPTLAHILKGKKAG